MNSRKSRSIESRSSRTAGFTCLARAASYMDKRECYSGSDNIAYILVPIFFKLLLKQRWLFSIFKAMFFAPGIYEYVIARTKYIDAAFVEALDNGFEQIVIFGAGFDSRALRFDNINKNTLVFELDAPTTQKDKYGEYQKKGLIIPSKLTLIPIDFNTDKLCDKLESGGFVKNKKTLFILEGVVMYLSADGVKSTFNYIAEASGHGSMLIFDTIYSGVLRKENKYYGEKDIYKTVSKVGEEWTFALENEDIADFLKLYGFNLEDNSNSNKLEKSYFTDKIGRITGKINATHSIIKGIKV